ncbi:hypothetical protein ACVNIS_20180 [Sphaerotilaceae bacterium SBD11-9]
MNFFERIPTRWLLAGAALACLALWAAPSSAQSTPDPVAGRTLFNDTVNATNLPLTGPCVSCHSPDVSNRRTAIGGSAFADISYATAYARFTSAMSRIGVMNQFSDLDVQQVADIAAYIADTPKVTAAEMTTTNGNALAFAAAASGVSVPKNLTLQHSVATTANLQITSITLTGSPAFTRGSGCGSTLAPASNCSFSVTYRPTSVSTDSATLTFSLRQGTTNFTRAVTLNGSVAGSTTPPAPANDDSGGGALGWAWLSGLALATAVLVRRRRA